MSKNIINAKLYSLNNSLQKIDASYALEKHLKNIKWRLDDTILDVGTGDGAVLLKLIIPQVSSKLEKIVAIDIDENMLRIAKKTTAGIPNVELVLLDIATPTIPSSFHENFNHIFSFYCLHWVSEKKRVIQNLFDMLRPNGDMLLTLVVNHLIYDVVITLSDNDKWKHFKKDFKTNFSSYYYSKDPVGEMEGYLKNIGLKNYQCELIEREFIYENISHFWNWSLGVNAFLKNIKKEDFGHYEKEFRSVVKNLAESRNFFENGKLRVPYKMLIVFAHK